MDNYREYEILKGKILKKLDQDKITSARNIISLYDLIEILKMHFNEYKDIYEDLPNEVNKINLKTKIYNLFGTNLPLINSIRCNYYKIEDNNFYKYFPLLEVKFNDDKKYAIFSKINDNYGVVSEKNNQNQESLDFYNYHRNILNKYLDSMALFSENYPLLPNLNANWFDKNNNIIIDDGFLYCEIDFNNLDHTNITFSKKDDLLISFIRKDNVDRELYEYIEFYNKDLQKKIPVNINTLDPSIRYILKHYYNIDKPLVRTLK